VHAHITRTYVWKTGKSLRARRVVGSSNLVYFSLVLFGIYIYIILLLLLLLVVDRRPCNDVCGGVSLHKAATLLSAAEKPQPKKATGLPDREEDLLLGDQAAASCIKPMLPQDNPL